MASQSPDTMDLDTEVRALKSGPIFRGLDDANMRLIAMTSDHLTLEPGETVYEYGELSEAVYFILQGEADFYVEGPSGPRRVARISRGALFGEVGVLAAHERAASVQAVSSLSLLRIDKDHFLRILRDNAQLSLALAKEMARRLEFVVSGMPAEATRRT